MGFAHKEIILINKAELFLFMWVIMTKKKVATP